MGAVTFSLDERLLRALLNALPISVFVETGTFEGDTVAVVAPQVPRVVSIECSERLWSRARTRFEGVPNVEVLLGHSPDVLARIRSSHAGVSVLYWLDAHWCSELEADGDKGSCPLLAELGAIAALEDTSALLIDDARLFLAPSAELGDIPGWPSFDDIVSALSHLSDRHALRVINDVIVFYPAAIEGTVRAFALEHGIDWLCAARSLDENPALKAALEEKEAVIQSQHHALEDVHRALGDLRGHLATLTASLEAKEAVIQSQHQSLRTTQEELARVSTALEERIRRSPSMRVRRLASTVLRLVSRPARRLFS